MKMKFLNNVKSKKIGLGMVLALTLASSTLSVIAFVKANHVSHAIDCHGSYCPPPPGDHGSNGGHCPPPRDHGPGDRHCPPPEDRGPGNRRCSPPESHEPDYKRCPSSEGRELEDKDCSRKEDSHEKQFRKTEEKKEV